MHTQTEFDFIQPPTQSLFRFSSSNDKIEFLNLKPNYKVCFHDGNQTIGVLDWNDGNMTFSGSADKSAQLFFDCVIKRYFQNPESVGPTGWKS